MTKIQGISDYANQSFQIRLPSGNLFTLTLQYKPLQLGWFCSVEYQEFKVNCLRVTTNYNILAQFRNLLPFGIACFTRQNQEPLFAQDFLAGNASLCILDAEELEELEEYLGTKV
jgi:hypothetical protein